MEAAPKEGEGRTRSEPRDLNGQNGIILIQIYSSYAKALSKLRTGTIFTFIHLLP